MMGHGLMNVIARRSSRPSCIASSASVKIRGMKPTKAQVKALDRAIKLAGGLSAAVPKFGVNRYQAIQQWRLNGVPAEHAPTIEEATGVPCEELCPGPKWYVLRRGAAQAKAA